MKWSIYTFIKMFRIIPTVLKRAALAVIFGLILENVVIEWMSSGSVSDEKQTQWEIFYHCPDI